MIAHALTGAAAALLSLVPRPGSAGMVLAQAQAITDVLTRLRNVVTGLLGGFATLILVYAGVLYLSAAGDPGQVERAKGALRAAAVGYGIAILAPALFEILRQVVGG